MKLRTTIIGLLLFVQLSCSDENIDITDLKDNSLISTLNGTWRVYSFENFTAMTTEHKTQENSWDKDITVTFDDSKSPHELSGTNITNTILGDFNYVGQRQFKMNSLSTTQVGQPDWADMFTDAILDNEASFKINTKQLRIYYDNETKSVTLNLVN